MTVDLETLRPANGGEAVARHDGRVVFVRGAIPGERVRARITDDRHAGYARAEVVEVLEASPHRIPPACPAAAHGAGCCDLSFVAPAHARDLKAQILSEVLARIGRLGTDVIDAVRPDDLVVGLGDDGSGWRVRTRLAVDDDGRAGVRAFHGSSIVVGHPCIQPEPGMLDGIDALPCTPGADVTIVADEDHVQHIVETAPPAAPRRRTRDPRRAAQSGRRRREAARPVRVIAGTDRATHRVGDRVWQIPVTGFWQAHRAAPTTYATTVRQMLSAVDLPVAPTVWDLYGGAGVFAAAALDELPSTAGVHIVDADPAALAAATETFGGDDRVHTHRGEVATSLTGLPAPTVVVADPPRTGAGERVVASIAAAEPAVIVHVGCDAGRFARDLALFAEHGYRVRELRGFDAFPQTHHVEAIACLVPTSTAH